MGKKARIATMDAMKAAVDARTPVCILSTSSLIGEGVDIPRLDTLILAMPVSFKGSMVQYAGRLNKEHPGKNDVIIHDYLDKCSGLTLSMYRKRPQRLQGHGIQGLRSAAERYRRISQLV